MPRLSITLTDAQAAALDRLAAVTGASKQSMISLAISEWLESHDRAHPSGWYGFVLVTEPDPLSGRPVTYRQSDCMFATREEAEDYATRLAASIEGDAFSGVSASAVARVEHVGQDRP